MGPGGPVALDFAALMLVGQAQGVDPALLADVLPAVEGFVIHAVIEESDNASHR